MAMAISTRTDRLSFAHANLSQTEAITAALEHPPRAMAIDSLLAHHLQAMVAIIALNKFALPPDLRSDALNKSALPPDLSSDVLSSAMVVATEPSEALVDFNSSSTIAEYSRPQCSSEVTAITTDGLQSIQSDNTTTKTTTSVSIDHLTCGHGEEAVPTRL